MTVPELLTVKRNRMVGGDYAFMVKYEVVMTEYIGKAIFFSLPVYGPRRTHGENKKKERKTTPTISSYLDLMLGQ